MSESSFLKRALFVTLGLTFVGLGAVGVVLPVLPTTPFLLLASYFFVRSSPRLHRWLRNSPLFGSMIRDWEEHRAVRRSVKITALLMVIVVIGATLLFAGLQPWLKVMLIVLGAIGMTVVASLRERPRELR